MIVIYQKCIVTILLLTNLCTVMTLGTVMICIFIISRNQLAKELFSILEVFVEFCAEAVRWVCLTGDQFLLSRSTCRLTSTRLRPPGPSVLGCPVELPPSADAEVDDDRSSIESTFKVAGRSASLKSSDHPRAASLDSVEPISSLVLA